MTVIVTGAAGFIGYHLCEALLEQGRRVLAVDNLNDYYDPALKRARLKALEERTGFAFAKVDLADRDAVFALFDGHSDVQEVVHLAAQAGVRYSLENPYAYVDSNIMGHLVVMEACRRLPNFRHLVYASSSSVYGGNSKVPFAVGDPVERPVSIYAATKRADELMSHTFAHLYGLPMTGLRFFTVYGPLGRPDMAYFSFTKAIFEGRPIKVFNQGDMRRDFTEIRDIVAGVLAALARVPESAPDAPPHRIYNLGNNNSENLLHFIEVLEEACGRKAEKVFAEMQPGDVKETFADITQTREDLGFEPRISIEEGLPRFVAWYRQFYGL
jgi:UDP-glucuronate 4-epimerase